VNTSEILAMVGSKDFLDTTTDGQVNVVTRLRQPGSSFKPITYLTALSKGYTAATVIADTPTKFPGGVGQPDYEPGNYDGKFRGPVQLRYALANSLNIPAVKIQSLVGLEDTLKLATELGIKSLPANKETLSRVGLSLSLGGGEVTLLDITSAYGAMVNGGSKVDPVAILRVEDRNGKVLEEAKLEKGRSVLSPELSYIISSILSDNEARSEVFGVNSLLNIPGRSVAVKTGTTNDKRDNWAIGGTPQLIVGSWVGNNDNKPMSKVASGVSGASPIWNRIIKAALSDLPRVDFEKPEGVVELEVDRVSGFIAHDSLPSRKEYFVKGTEPTGQDTIHTLIKLCRGDGKLATPSDIAANNYESKPFIKLVEKDPFESSNWPNRWQEGIDSWISQLPSDQQSKYKPPTEFCGSGSSFPINVEFLEPRDRTSNLPNTFTVKFMVDSIENIEEVKLEIDGVLVKTFAGNDSFEYQASLMTGKHSLRIVAKDTKGRESDRKIDIGVGTSWE
jgi:membrane carboxypeptidase/penicillin-binding protein